MYDVEINSPAEELPRARLITADAEQALVRFQLRVHGHGTDNLETAATPNWTPSFHAGTTAPGAQEIRRPGASAANRHQSRRTRVSAKRCSITSASSWPTIPTSTRYGNLAAELLEEDAAMIYSRVPCVAILFYREEQVICFDEAALWLLAIGVSGSGESAVFWWRHLRACSAATGPDKNTPRSSSARAVRSARVEFRLPPGRDAVPGPADHQAAQRVLATVTRRRITSGSTAPRRWRTRATGRPSAAPLQSARPRPLDPGEGQA